MADYITITDAQVDPEAPITSELMSALRDNPTAITEGATGAPKVQRAAIQDDAVNLSKIDLNAATYSGSISTSSVFISIPSNYAFFPRWTSSSADIQVSLYYDGRIRFLNTGELSRTYSITFRWIQ